MKEEEKRLRKEIRELTSKARRTDAQEDKRYGRAHRGDELPAELSRREARLEKIQQARQRLEARQREADEEHGREPGDDDRNGKPGRPFKRRFGEPDEKAQDNFTDPESRIMKRGSSGFEQCYNAQIAVDETQRLIVATEVTQSASDVEQLIPLLDEVKKNTGQEVAHCLADAGYRSESNLQALEDRKIEGFVAMGREKDGAEKRASPELPATQRMAQKIRTQRGREMYRKRKWIGEPPFSWIKSAMGFDRFHLRGLTQVSGEWDLACLAANLRRMQGMMAWT
jgi:IS5 family transposase